MRLCRDTTVTAIVRLFLLLYARDRRPALGDSWIERSVSLGIAVARLQQKIRIGCADDDIVGCDVLIRCGDCGILVTSPAKGWFGKDATENEALSPSVTSPMFLPLTIASM
jgi:hypothetical protein